MAKKEKVSSEDSKTKGAEKATTLILKGGGIKGLAYVGALEVLKEYGYRFEWFVGTSAGAITAVLLGAGYESKTLENELKKKNFKDFKDPRYLIPLWNLITKGGLYESDDIGTWIDELISRDPNNPEAKNQRQISFEKLYLRTGKRVTIYASTEGLNALTFDSESAETKGNPVSFAVRSSIAIPFFFVPTSVADKPVFDGGMQNNYPVNIFLNENPDVKDFIGLYLGDEAYKKDTSKSILSKIPSIWIEADDTHTLNQYQNQTIVIDPSPISTLDFVLNNKEKDFLVEAGRLAAIKFLKGRGELAITNPNAFNEEEKAHKKVRAELIKERKDRTKRKKILWLAAIICLPFFLPWGYKFLYIHSPEYKQEIINSLGFEASFLKIKPGLNKSNKIPCNLNTLNIHNQDLSDFLEHNFDELPVENYDDLIWEIDRTEHEIRLKLHFSDVTKYNGFKFKLNKVKSPEGEDPLLQTPRPDAMWTKYAAYAKCGNQPYEFLLDDCLKTGDYNFTVEIHKP